MADTKRTRYQVEQGARFGHLLAINHTIDKTNTLRWTFRCTCGNTINLLPLLVIAGASKDCGCGYMLHSKPADRLTLEEAVIIARRDGIAASVRAIVAEARGL